jgi:hypothetical protein
MGYLTDLVIYLKITIILLSFYPLIYVIKILYILYLILQII